LILAAARERVEYHLDQNLKREDLTPKKKKTREKGILLAKDFNDDIEQEDVVKLNNGF
jgi:hypothetical protein